MPAALRVKFLFTIPALLIAFAGCFEPAIRFDAGVPPEDAGPMEVDAGSDDAGQITMDGGSDDMDAGIDAGPIDAGVMDVDAGIGALEDPDLQVFLTPNSAGHVEMIDAINGAAASVHMVMYHLTEAAVVQALIAATARHVDVEVILDESSLSGSSEKKAYNTLVDGGVDVIKSSTKFSITHEKAMVVDDNAAYITSMNMTNTYKTTRDYGVVTRNTDVIGEWDAVFAADLLNAENETKNTPALTVPSLVWSPVDSEDKLVALINSANTSVSATVESFTTTDVLTALEDAAQRGVSVKMLVPECVENPNPLLDYHSLSDLADAGGSVRVTPNPSSAAAPYMHGKMIVVDGTNAFIGSENFSVNSLTAARECGIIFSNADAITTLQAAFESDWSAAADVPDPLPTNCPG